MIGLLQRVRHARVEVKQNVIAEIDTGLLVLIGIAKQDNEARAEHLIRRILGYRVFPDSQGKMNLSLVDVDGGLLLVPQFTLVAETHKGMRPGFSAAAKPETGQRLFEHLLKTARSQYEHVSCGEFGANMQVSLLNDGPVTFSLEV